MQQKRKTKRKSRKSKKSRKTKKRKSKRKHIKIAFKYLKDFLYILVNVKYIIRFVKIFCRSENKQKLLDILNNSNNIFKNN